MRGDLIRPVAAYVYALCDPRTGEERYVGSTRHHPGARLARHMGKEANPAVKEWLDTVPGRRPAVRILAECKSEEEARRKEARIIQARASSRRLLNIMFVPQRPSLKQRGAFVLAEFPRPNYEEVRWVAYKLRASPLTVEDEIKRPGRVHGPRRELIRRHLVYLDWLRSLELDGVELFRAYWESEPLSSRPFTRLGEFLSSEPIQPQESR